MTDWVVTAIRDSDRAVWENLYRSYHDFYEVSSAADKLDRVWGWLRDPTHELDGIVVRPSIVDDAVGLAHYRPFVRPLHATIACYLDDLFVTPSSRGTGAVDALLAELQRIAAANGWEVIRWITRETNARARSTYERLAQRTNLITYDLPPA